ncbi:MAG: hypothetical protein FWC93_04110 [Defluviitaleaceae bacterium]|nr:hypothetical protein [Defluviitaleaceae bacterium]
MEQNKQKTGKFTAKKIVSAVGTLLMVASLAFIAQRLMASEMDFALLASPWTVAGLLAVAMMEGSGILAAGVNFRSLIRNVSGVLVTPALAMKVYATSNIYKYIPGGIMYVLGRNVIAVENKNIGHGKVAMATALEGVFIVVAAIILIIVLAFDYAMAYIQHIEIAPPILIVPIILLALALLVAYLLRRRIIPHIRKLAINKDVLHPLILLKRLGFSIIILILLGWTFLATLMILGQSVTPSLAAAVVGLYLLAWLAGFLTPGAPSGLGIREAVALMFMGNLVDCEVVLLSAIVTHRVVHAVGDVFAYCVAGVYYKIDLLRK